MIETNADEVAGWWEESAEGFEDELEEAKKSWAERVHERATDEVPVDTGDLRDSLTKVEGEVYSTLDYAPHVGLGTIYMEQQDYLWGPAREELAEVLKQLAS